jgi:mRNA interferase RelE/StbE
MYELVVRGRVRKSIDRLPGNAYRRVSEAIEGLREEPRPPGCRKLSDREGWRLRVGDYRVIYEKDDEQRTVTVLQVGHRRDVYR